MPEPDPIAPWQWILIVPRALALLTILLIGVMVSALMRLVEQPLCGVQRPVTPFVTVLVCRLCLHVIGLRLRSEGERMRGAGAVVANHSSWLDIFALNAHKRVYFVSKSEVAGWPGIGLLARITGTVFIARDPRQARTQVEIFEERLRAGHKLLFFPEGTSTDGMRVLPFRTTLFQSFFAPELRDDMQIQPVTLVYTAPMGRGPQFYGWWGDMSFGAHLVRVLASPHQGEVKSVYHLPIKVSEFTDRKALARELEGAVRSGMPTERRVSD
jgi:1-acyl-sn-glycerol-3-phosphate acyltransferase